MAMKAVVGEEALSMEDHLYLSYLERFEAGSFYKDYTKHVLSLNPWILPGVFFVHSLRSC